MYLFIYFRGKISRGLLIPPKPQGGRGVWEGAYGSRRGRKGTLLRTKINKSIFIIYFCSYVIGFV